MEQKTDQDSLLGRLTSGSSRFSRCLVPFVAALCLAGLGRALVLCLWELPEVLIPETYHQSVTSASVVRTGLYILMCRAARQC